jgi:hypothetical protein
MGRQGKVRLNGRFSSGTRVELVKVGHAGVLRSEGGEVVDSATVGKDGSVEFEAEPAGRYFIRGVNDGFPLEVRVTGRETSDVNSEVAQPPVRADRVRLSDGSWADEAPDRVKRSDQPVFEGAPHASQTFVADGQVQRSDTPRGSAHPHDPEEPSPLPDISSRGKGQVLMSDTPLGTLHPAEVGAQRQEDVPAGTWQRSDTPTGVAAPLPKGGPVRAQEEKEASESRAKRGTPQQTAAQPLGTSKVTGGKGAKNVSNAPAGLTQPSMGQSRSGHDAMGQPAYEDVARATGVPSAEKPTAVLRSDPAEQKPDTDDPLVSGRAAARDATPEPTRRVKDEPVEGGKAEDQTS